MKGNTIPFLYQMGESMIEPFWDPSISGLAQWKIGENGAEGVKVQQYWCYVTYEWHAAGEDGTGIVISREYDELQVEDYDALVLSLVIPENGFVVLMAATKLGVISIREEGAGKKEVLLPLNGAESIQKVTIVVGNTTGNSGTGWLNWLGAQNTALMETYQKQYRQFDEHWEGYIREESYEPAFEPEYGLLVSREELKRFRSRYQHHLQNGGKDTFYENIRPYLELKPEDMISDYVRLFDDYRYCRIRDENQYTANGLGEKLVQYALLSKDRKILRLAARYAMSLMMTSYWLDGFIANYPPGIWEHSAFVPSAILSDMAVVLDGAGEILTGKAKKMMRMQMMEKGLSKVNSVIWRNDDIFKCNQLAWYSYGRMSAYAVLSESHKRMLPYLELARQDVEKSMELAIGRDGAAEEGISYFLYQPGNSGGGLFWYARVFEKEFGDCLPSILYQTADYIDALSSTQEEKAFLPICDFSEPKDLRGLAVMAYAMPESMWVNAYHKKKKAFGGLPDDFISLLLDEKIPREGNLPRSYVCLAEAGYQSSYRKTDDGVMKVFIMGGKAGAGHNHEDKGSFLVEYEGEAFLTDPGMVSYGEAQSRSLKMCDYHNMLLPTGVSENPHPKNPLSESCYPEGFGDGKELHVSIELTESFDSYYNSWKRRLDSMSTAELVLTDQYDLKRGSGVMVLLNTWLETEQNVENVMIKGKKARCTIEIPEDMRAEITKRDIQGTVLNQIKLFRDGTEGVIEINFRFERLQTE